jgi:hypothetical protein
MTFLDALLKPWIVIVFVAVPDLVMEKPPAGAVSVYPEASVKVTGELIVAEFNAVTAAASEE